MNPEMLLEEANKWQQRAREHDRLAEFSRQQAARFLARLSVPDDYRAELRLVDGTRE